MIEINNKKVKGILIATDKVVSIDEAVDRSKPNGDIIVTSQSIGSYSFSTCPITSIECDTATSIGEYAFCSCKDLVTAIIPNATSMGQYAFSNDNNIITIDVRKVTSLGVGVFYNCSKLLNINASSATSVTSYAFRYCSGIKEIRLPKLSGTVGQTFQGCTNLETLDLGVCTSMGSNGYGSCSKLSTIVLRKTSICSLGSSTCLNDTCFKSGGTGGTIYIPKSLYDHLGDGTSSDYKNATNWKVYDGYGTITWAKIEGSEWEL